MMFDKPVIRWDTLKWRKYPVFQRTKQKAAQGVTMIKDFEFIDIYPACKGHFLKRKKLSLWCLLHCPIKKECKKRHKRFVFWDAYNVVGLYFNTIVFFSDPHLLSGIGALFLLTVMIVDYLLFMKATNATLNAIDHYVPLNARGPY